MTIQEIQDEIIEEFSELDDWMDRYQLLIDLGNEQEPLDEKYKTESNLIDGCQSRVWLQADYRDDKLWFTAESDALIVKGIVSLLIRHPFQRSAGHGEADESVRHGFSCEKRGINSRSVECGVWSEICFKNKWFCI